MQLGKMLSKHASSGPDQALYLANRHVQWDRVALDTLDTMSFTPDEREKYSLRPGDLLVCEGGEVGRTALWHGEREDTFFQKAIHRLRPRNGEVAPSYMLRFMRFAAERGHFTDLASQTSIAHLTQEKLALLEIPLPPRDEQRRIAEILDTLDEAIRKTEQLIAKLKQVKQGLLYDLLTRGVDDNGELREPERHTEQFKDSLLGRIPQAWEVVALGELASERITNGVFKDPSRVGTGIPLVNVGDLYADFGVDLRQVERFRASTVELSRFAVVPGDIFFTRSSLALSGIAHCNIIREVKEPAVFECHLMRLRTNRTRALPEFVAHWCRSPTARSFLMGRAKQVTMTTIAQPDIAPHPVPVPSLSEQRRIVDILDGHERRLVTEAEAGCKLRFLKHGLMEDLLTGRLRVTSLAGEVPA
jgi:type I restriction enzyme S subunit